MNIIETYTLEMIGESVDSPDVFTDDADGMEPIRDSINDAIEEITMITGCTKRDYYLALREDRNFYRLDFTSGTFAWVTDVWLVTQKRRLPQTDIARLNILNPRWMLDTGNPQAYFQLGLNYIGVWPAPATDTDLLEITSVIVPDRYGYEDDALTPNTTDYIATFKWEFGSDDASDGIHLRKNWDWAAAHYAAGEYWASRGDAKTAIYHHNNYLKRLGFDLKYPYSSEKLYQFQSDKNWGNNVER